MEMLDEYPDIVIGCAGGGSNLGGLIAPFMQDKLAGKADPAHHRGGTGFLPVLDPRQVCVRFLRYRQSYAARADVYARQRLHARRPTTRAACATTA